MSISASRVALALALVAVACASVSSAFDPARLGTLRKGTDRFFQDHVHDYQVVEAARVLSNGHAHGRFSSRLTGEARDIHGHRLHEKSLRYVLRAYNRDFDLVLERNDELLHPDYIEEHVDRYDNVVKTVRGAENCYYVGKVANDDSSRVAVSTCFGLHGLIRTHDDEFFIEPAHTRLAHITQDLNQHIFYRTADVRGIGNDTHTCGVDHSHHINKDLFESANAADVTDLGLVQDVHESLEDAPAGDGSLRRRADENFIEVALANDNARYRDYGSQTEAHALTVMNIVYTRYADANFNPSTRCVMIRQRTFSDGNPFTVTSNSQTLLNRWCDYKYASFNYGDNGVLFSGIDFDGSTIGLAWVGTMCQSGRSCNIDQESNLDHVTAATIAHEIGHNMNMPHDSTDNARTCPQSGFIMQAVVCSNCPAVTQFSSCSKSILTSFYSSRRTQLVCLDNEPETGWTRPECGNGVLEEGEECDSQSSCCNRQTCQLVSGAVCDAGSQDCCSSSCTWDVGAPCGSNGRCYGEGECNTYEDTCINALSGFSVGEVSACGSVNPGGCGWLHCDIQQFNGCTNLQSIRATGLQQRAPDGMPCVNGYCEGGDCKPYDPSANSCPFVEGRICNGRGDCVDSECDCDQGWTGDDCATPPPCPRHNGLTCNNHGNCVDGECQCTDNWTGDVCQFVPQCPKVNGVDCNGQGACNEGICTCVGAWQGDACDVPNCLGEPDCSGRGSCVLSGGQPTCNCNNGWQGSECQTPDCPGTPDCSGHGSCNPPFFIFPAYCDCNSGWSGDDCSVCEPGNSACAPAETQSPRPQTQSPRPHTQSPRPQTQSPRPQTQRPGDPDTESPRPQTQSPRPQTQSPRPATQSPRPATQSPRPAPECPNDCSDHGRCIVSDNTATCACDNTWKGDDCSENACPGDCGGPNQGTCDRFWNFDPYCTCRTGWTGDDCTQIDCPANPLCSQDDDDDNTGDDDDDLPGNGEVHRLLVTNGPAAGTVVGSNAFVNPPFKVRAVDRSGKLVRTSAFSVGIVASAESTSLGIDIIGGGARPLSNGEVTFDFVTIGGPRGATFMLTFLAIGASSAVESAQSVPLVLEPCPESTAPLESNNQLCGCDQGFGGTTSFDCSPCPIGQYKAEVGNNLCELCPTDTSTPTIGSTSRDDCACRQFAGADEDVCTFVYEPIGPDGGEFDIPGVVVTIPEGAIPDGEKNVTIVHVDSGTAPIPSWLKLVSAIRQFGPSGQTFDPPVEVVFNLLVDEITDWDNVRVFIAPDGSDEWEEVDSVVDQDEAICAGRMPHFTMAAAFEIVGEPEDEDGDDDGSSIPLIPIFIGCGALIGVGAIGGGLYTLKKRRAAMEYKNFDDWGGSSAGGISGRTAATQMTDLSARSAAPTSNGSGISGPLAVGAPRSLPQTPLPRNWVQSTTAEGDVFFSNTVTGETTWTRPV